MTKQHKPFSGMYFCLCLLLLVGCDDKEASPASDPKTEPTQESSVTTAGLAVPKANPTAGTESTFRKMPGMDCLVNEHGIRRKIIVSRRNARCSLTPGGAVSGMELLYFRPYYVFDEVIKDGAVQFFQVGTTPRTDSIKGWIPASTCAEWDHRVAVRYRRDGNRRIPPLTVYKDKKTVIELAQTGKTSAEPLARAAYSTDTAPAYMPWPVVDVDRIEVKGGIQEILKLAFIGDYKVGGAITEDVGEAGSATQYSEAEIQRIKSNVRMLDVCFVLDTTKSTGPYIHAMKQTVVALSRNLHSLSFRPDLALGLCQYRDYVDGLMFTVEGNDSVVHLNPLNNDLKGFITTVDPIDEASVGSNDWSESVYDGIWEALNKAGWRGDKLSGKAVVLIGDNSAHPAGTAGNPKGITPAQIIEKAKSLGVRIFAVSIKGAGGEDEQKRHWDQFQELANGTGGKCFPMEPNVVDKLAALITEVLTKQTATVGERSFVVDALSAGKSKTEIMAERQMDIGEFTEIMEFLGQGGVDGSRIARAPTFATGWCLGEFGGVSLVKKEVYCARSELDMLMAELNVLALHLSPDFTQGLASIGLGSRIHPGSFFAQREPGPMDLFLMKQGIPVSNGILKLTRAEIEHMPEDRRARLREDVIRHYIPQILNQRNSDRFIYADDLEFGFIDEETLP